MLKNDGYNSWQVYAYTPICSRYVVCARPMFCYNRKMLSKFTTKCESSHTLANDLQMLFSHACGRIKTTSHPCADLYIRAAYSPPHTLQTGGSMWTIIVPRRISFNHMWFLSHTHRRLLSFFAVIIAALGKVST